MYDRRSLLFAVQGVGGTEAPTRQARRRLSSIVRGTARQSGLAILSLRAETGVSEQYSYSWTEWGATQPNGVGKIDVNDCKQTRLCCGTLQQLQGCWA